MGIVGNYSVLHKSPGRFLSGTVASCDRANYSKSGGLKNRFLGDHGLGLDKKSAIPQGYVHPYSWNMARVSGGLAAFKGLEARLTKTEALLALGINIDANLTAEFAKVDAILALIVALEASLSASGTITDAQLAIILQMQAALTGSGSFTDAQLGNILGLAAQLSATGLISNSITTLVNLSADIGGASPLSPEGLAARLLDTEEIETGYTMRESLRLIVSALVGKVSGASGTTITIRDINDSVDRIVATVDASGNRTAVTKDVS